MLYYNTYSGYCTKIFLRNAQTSNKTQYFVYFRRCMQYVRILNIGTYLLTLHNLVQLMLRITTELCSCGRYVQFWCTKKTSSTRHWILIIYTNLNIYRSASIETSRRKFVRHTCHYRYRFSSIACFTYAQFLIFILR